MKKIFTLIAAALMAVGVNADEVVLIEKDMVCDNWSGVGILSDAGIELANAGAQPGDFIKLYADLSGAAEGWQLNINEGHWDKIPGTNETVVYYYFSQENGDFADGTAQFELTEEIYNRAMTKSWWGNVFILNGKGGVKVTKVSLIRPVTIAETPTAVPFDAENGFIAASAFEGAHERSMVKFTYNVEGTLKNPDGEGWEGWGIGCIGSNDDGPSVKVAELPAAVLGENSVTVLLKDLKKALDVTADGVIFKLWPFGDGACTASRVKVELFAATVDTPDAIKAVKAERNDDVRYNLAGQKVGESYKGIVIVNGKKMIQK